MQRGPIYDDDYRPQFSGHETFPLRYGWLKKAYDAVSQREDDPNGKLVFTQESSIARFGVGKNMVSSMRHWAAASGIIENGETPNALVTTSLGKRLFGKDGLDRYVEHPATLWLIHWQLAGHPEKTTWYWSFNNFPGITFEREQLVNALERVAKDCEWRRVSATTIRRDVECFLRTTVAKAAPGAASIEDSLESPLAELGLIKAIGRRDGFRFVRGPKSSLGIGVFMYALIDFWKTYTSALSLSFEAVAHEPGSPGRVFLLEENDVADRLIELEHFTKGSFRWSETSGLKQVIRDGPLDMEAALIFAMRDYKKKRIKGRKEH